MIALLTRLVEALIEERLALAELHRANARRAEVVPVSPFVMPALVSDETSSAEFFACSHRAASAFLQDIQDASLVACPFHKLAEDVTCPSEPEQDLASLDSEEGYPYPVAPIPVPSSAQALP